MDFMLGSIEQNGPTSNRWHGSQYFDGIVALSTSGAVDAKKASCSDGESANAEQGS
jgi:hypothetical protein